FFFGLGGRNGIIARTAEGMAFTEAPHGEPSPPHRTVPDQGVAPVIRTGRHEPALLADQGGQRQLIAPMGRADAAFVERHLSLRRGLCFGFVALIPLHGRGINRRAVQAAPARRVRVSLWCFSSACFTASSVASSATMVEAWRAG